MQLLAFDLLSCIVAIQQCFAVIFKSCYPESFELIICTENIFGLPLGSNLRNTHKYPWDISSGVKLAVYYFSLKSRLWIITSHRKLGENTHKETAVILDTFTAIAT